MMSIPSFLLSEVDELVQEGRFADRDSAIVELVRIGLEVVRARPRPIPHPARPPVPPGVREPSDDRPIEVDPATDVNWAP
jgi:hypothetical protein